MGVVNSNIKVTPNACRDVIGVRGVCDDVTYPYYLDPLGLSLQKTAKLADSAHATAKELLEDSINLAWGQVYKDVKVDDFRLHGVQKTYANSFTDNLAESLAYQTKMQRGCEFETFFYNKIAVKVSGTLALQISAIIDGVAQVLYSASATDETITINIDNEIVAATVEFKVLADGSGKMYKTSCGGAILFDGYTQCSERLFFCKYWQYLITAVQYKTVAIVLNNSLFNDRYNDFIAYKKEEIALRLSQLDNSFVRGKKVNDEGLYQVEIKNINFKLKEILKKEPCLCCFTCDGIVSTKIAML